MAMATKHICVGVTAHVDAGKTTLNEALLYTGGQLRRLGRVDHGDAYLDTDQLERERGITIFSKQALLPLGEEKELILMDTPGHADFSAEMERTLQVLDCAVLVISGTDGVQGHTRTLWRLLERYHLPVFLFVNKMDLAGADRSAVLNALREGLDSRCTDFTAARSARDEEIALCDEGALEDFLSGGAVPDEAVARLVAQRKLFPCWFGSALKLEGVEELLSGLERYAPAPDYPKEFAARVFKITRDDQGNRLTWMKITGGSLKAKTPLSGGAGEERWEEKADQLRLYSGAKFRAVDRAEADLSGGHVGDDHRNDKGGHGVIAPALSPAVGLGHGLKAADAAGADDPAAGQVLPLPVQAAVVHGLLGGDEGKLGKAVHLLGLPLAQNAVDVQVLHLSGQLYPHVRAVIPGDGADAALAVLDRLPALRHAVSNGVHRAHAGDHDPTFFHSNLLKFTRPFRRLRTAPAR